MLRVTFRVLALAALLSAVRAEDPFSFEKTPGLLPKQIVPQHYRIRIEPDLTAGTFRGRETIEVELRAPAREIVLHANNLTVSRARLGDTPLTPRIDREQQTLTFALESELPAGPRTLEIEFAGQINEHTSGLFFAYYQEGAERKRGLATQMEATDARRLFPCWDEPAFRATFEFTAVVPGTFAAISNMPARDETPLADGRREIAFARTPSMPTYLFAFFAGELESLEDEVEGVKLRVFTTRGKREQARYALEATKQILPFFNDYFGTKYPLPKLDQVAFPSTGASGMENWGAILYADTAFLYDPATSSQSTRERVFEVVAHELAHQWFGNLVTMAWWDNLWLNEGFASWMGTKATDRFNPEWQAWLRAAGSKEGAMSRDARATTHPIQQPVKSDAEATDSFDEITYNKGQAFIRMLEAYLGEQPFREGIRAYMKRHAYSNTTTADLWKALEESSGKPVRSLAAGWTQQPGFPVVQLAESAAAGSRQVTLSQERFTLNDPSAPPLFWAIPVSFGPAAAPLAASSVLLKERTLPPIPIEAGAAIKANLGDTGYYRVHYDDALFKRLRKAASLMAVADRLNLLNDTWAMAQAGRAPVTRALELIETLRDDPAPTIVQRLIEIVSTVHTLEKGQPQPSAFAPWAIRLLQPHLARLGYDARPDDSPLAVMLRSSLFAMLGRLGDEAVQREAERRFRVFLAKETPLASDLRRSVLKIIGRTADAATWEKLHALARAESSTELKNAYYDALTAARDEALARRALALALGDELPPERAAYLVHGVAGEGEHPQLALDFALANLDALTARVGALGGNSYVPGLYRNFTEEARAAELEALARKSLPPGAGYQVARAADDIRFKAALKKRLLPDIDAWCRAQPGK